MDPCPFVRLIIESLALKLPAARKPAGAGIYPSSTPCYCTVKLKNYPTQTTLLPLSLSSPIDNSPPSSSVSVGFHLDPAALRRLSTKPLKIKISVYSGRMGRTCGVTCGRLMGSVHVSGIIVGGKMVPVQYQSGWVKIGSEPDRVGARLHVVVRGEPDPRFVFQFGGEPECSPVVYQMQGNIRQPVFSCKFSADRNRTRCLALATSFITALVGVSAKVRYWGLFCAIGL